MEEPIEARHGLQRKCAYRNHYHHQQQQAS